MRTDAMKSQTWMGCFAMKARLSTMILVSSVAAQLAADPPEEIRIGSLGLRGVTFTEERPGTFSEIVFGAGDVNGDGRSDVLLLHDDRALDTETVFLVFGRRTCRRDPPAGLPASRPRSMAGRYLVFDGIEGGPADLDGDTFDDFFIFRPYGSSFRWSAARTIRLPASPTSSTAPPPCLARSSSSRRQG